MSVYSVISVQYITFSIIDLKLLKFKVRFVYKISISEFGNAIPTDCSKMQ
jgi:hypothetical protein